MRQKRNSNQKKSRRIFKNEDIKAFTILVVDEDGEQLGKMSRKKALEMAQQQWLDLVQIHYDPVERVCTAKLVDFGKYQYEKKKSESEKRKKQKSKVQKEVKFGYNIWDHDLDLKVKKWISFLGKGHPLKINVVLRWREREYKNIVRAKLDAVEETLKAYGKTQWVRTESFGYTLVIVPNKNNIQKRVDKKESKKRESSVVKEPFRKTEEKK